MANSLAALLMTTPMSANGVRSSKRIPAVVAAGSQPKTHNRKRLRSLAGGIINEAIEKLFQF